MSEPVIFNELNLEEHPGVLRPVTEDDEVTLGDMHGNALKFLHFLVLHGVLTITPEDYQTFVAIYNKNTDDLTAEDLAEYQNILNRAAVNPVGLVRLMGDDLCDRGSNDYFTLKLYEKLHQANMNLEVIYSNHTSEFLNKMKNDNVKLWIGPGDRPSLTNLLSLVKKGLVNQAEAQKIVTALYTPKLKAISYSVDRSQPGEPTIMIFTHAPIGQETLKALAKEFKVKYDASNVDKLCQTIDRINNAFLDWIQQPNSILAPFDSDYRRIRIDDPINRLIWNWGGVFNPDTKQVDYPRLSSETDMNLCPDIDPNIPGVNVKWGHGHTGPLGPEDNLTGSLFPTMMCLDGNHGKRREFNQGTFISLLGKFIPKLLNSLYSKRDYLYGKSFQDLKQVENRSATQQVVAMDGLYKTFQKRLKQLEKKLAKKEAIQQVCFTLLPEANKTDLISQKLTYSGLKKFFPKRVLGFFKSTLEKKSEELRLQEKYTIEQKQLAKFIQTYDSNILPARKIMQLQEKLIAALESYKENRGKYVQEKNGTTSQFKAGVITRIFRDEVKTGGKVLQVDKAIDSIKSVCPGDKNAFEIIDRAMKDLEKANAQLKIGSIPGYIRTASDLERLIEKAKPQLEALKPKEVSGDNGQDGALSMTMN